MSPVTRLFPSFIKAISAVNLSDSYENILQIRPAKLVLQKFLPRLNLAAIILTNAVYTEQSTAFVIYPKLFVVNSNH